jgi:hypothetical protein
MTTSSPIPSNSMMSVYRKYNCLKADISITNESLTICEALEAF